MHDTPGNQCNCHSVLERTEIKIYVRHKTANPTPANRPIQTQIDPQCLPKCLSPPMPCAVQGQFSLVFADVYLSPQPNWVSRSQHIHLFLPVADPQNLKLNIAFLANSNVIRQVLNTPTRSSAETLWVRRPP